MRLTLVMSRGRHIVPASPEDRAKLRAYKPGDVLLAKTSKARNYAHHAKFMALVSFVAEYHPDWRNHHSVEPLLYALKMATGHFDAYTIEATGEIIQVPRSISFDEMDEAAFIVWSDKARTILLDHMLPGFTDQDKRRLKREIEGWQEWT